MRPQELQRIALNDALAEIYCIPVKGAFERGAHSRDAPTVLTNTLLNNVCLFSFSTVNVVVCFS